MYVCGVGVGSIYELEGGIPQRCLKKCYIYFKKFISKRGKIAYISNVKNTTRKKKIERVFCWPEIFTGLMQMWEMSYI